MTSDEVNRITAKRRDLWTRAEYGILNLMPAGEWEAVFADNEPDGTVSLRSDPMDFMAVATVTEITYENVSDPPVTSREVRRSTRTSIVGVQWFGDMGWTPVEEFSNFAGYRRYGEPLSVAVDGIPVGDAKRLRPEFRSQEEPTP